MENEKLQNINKLLQLKKQNIHFNKNFEEKKEFQNPKLPTQLFEYLTLDSHGSNLQKTDLPVFASLENFTKLLNSGASK